MIISLVHVPPAYYSVSITMHMCVAKWVWLVGSSVVTEERFPSM